MKTFAIKARPNDEERIASNYENGKFISSFLFRGCNEKSNTAFFVTHGVPGEEGGYYVMDCGGLREKEYTQEEFAFYMNGLLEYNPEYTGVSTIVTIECFGGYHRKSHLALFKRTIPMRPLSSEKCVLWAGWRKKDDGLYLICVAYSPEEYEILEKANRVDTEVDLVISQAVELLNPRIGLKEWVWKDGALV